MTKADKEGQRKAPILRFKGFTDDWEQRKLQNQVQFFSGLTYSPNDVKSVGTFVIRSSNIKDNTLVSADNVYVNPDIANSEPVKKDDVIMVVRNGSKSLIGKHALVTRKINNTVIGAFMTGIRSSTPYFLDALLDTVNFKKEIYKNLGATINQITVGNLRKMTFKVPNESEKFKIGNLFKKLNYLLALYDRKLKLVKLIYKELENKVYNNDLIKQTNFTKVKLGEILKEKNIKSTYEDQYPVLSSTNSGIELRNGRTNSSSNIGYKVLSKNELVLSPQNLWLGNININFNFENGLVSPSYKVFSLTNNVNIIYLNSLLHHPKMMYLYKVVSVQGASVVRRNLDIEAFKNLTLKLPSIDAQDKIGNLLDKNKQLIDNLENKKEQFSKVKTTLLNTMFI